MANKAALSNGKGDPGLKSKTLFKAASGFCKGKK